MMVAASAPGKIILFGEHAVVYGQPGVAVPVSSLRVRVEVRTSDSSQRGIRLIAPDFERVLLPDTLSRSINDALELTIRLVLDHVSHAAPDLTVYLSSDIPIASGLGSGAAVSAALARGLSQALGCPLNNSALNELVYEVEKIHHGTPSGIDNTVIVYEKPVYFVRSRPVEIVSIPVPFTLLIGDTGQSASTRLAVSDVRELVDTQPQQVIPVLEAIGSLVREARAAIEAGAIHHLGPLMDQNHVCLQRLTVSSPQLDTLIEAARQAGALGAKLSGGGRGGNMIALVTPGTVDAIRENLLRAGAARVFQTTVQ